MILNLKPTRKKNTSCEDVSTMSPRCQLNEPMSLSDDEQKAAVTESYTRL